MQEFSIDIDPNGAVRMVYRDDSPVGELGRMKCERLSNVVFNETTELWEVEILRGKEKGARISDSTWTQRSQAIAWEMRHFEENFDSLLDSQENIC